MDRQNRAPRATLRIVGLLLSMAVPAAAQPQPAAKPTPAPTAKPAPAPTAPAAAPAPKGIPSEFKAAPPAPL